MAEKGFVSTNFGTDRPLLFTISPWKEMGFAVPNFGDNATTLSIPIHGLADYIGQAQLFIMTHIDAARTQAPSRNTIERLGKMLNRVQSVLSSRAKQNSDLLTEPGHASPAPNVWNIHPVPYYGSGFCRNPWLREYNELTMIALTNMYQHSDNNRAINITAKFSADIYAYFREVKNLLGVELLAQKPADVMADGFLFDTSMYEKYAPEKFVMNFEALDTPGPIEGMPTEDDLRVLFRGFPATDIAPHLAQYPANGIDPGTGWSGSGFSNTAAAVGTLDDSQVQSKGGTIGYPTL